MSSTSPRPPDSGYTIAPFDPKTAGPDQAPSIVAIPLSVRDAGRIIHLRTLDGAGHPIAGSERQIRIVAPPALVPLYALVSLVPILAMGIVLMIRARRRLPVVAPRPHQPRKCSATFAIPFTMSSMSLSV